MRPPVLIVPGWGDSGPEHWQSLWERANPDFRRVAQRDWLYPVRGEWVETLEHEIRTAGEPVVLVAHSLGCLAGAHCVWWWPAGSAAWRSRTVRAIARCACTARCSWHHRTWSGPTFRP